MQAPSYQPRILILASEYPPAVGGVSVLSHQQALGLARLGWKVRVLSVQSQPPHLPPTELHPRLEVISRPTRGKAILRLPELFFHARRELETFRPHGILCPAYRGFGVPTVALSRRHNCPAALYFHGTELFSDGRKGLRRVLLGWSLLHAKTLLTNSHNTANLIQDLFPRQPLKPVVVHPGAVSVAPLPEVPDREQLRSQWCTMAGYDPCHHNRVTIFLACCRLVLGKGLQTALEAFHQIPPDRPVIYVIIGDGPYKEPLKGIANRGPRAQNVLFLGQLPAHQIGAYLLAADAYLQPSQPDGPFLESFGISFVEAQAAGLPCIASEWGGIPEATIPETTRLIHPGSISDAWRGMQWAIHLTAQEKRKIAEHGKAHAARFTWQIHAQLLSKTLGQSWNIPLPSAHV